MAFEEIEWIGQPVAIDALSPNGVRVRPRAFKTKHGTKHWIEINLGKSLATKLSLLGDESGLRLMVGTGEDAGKLSLTPDQGGRFKAKRCKSGSYRVAINAASAEGLFALGFDAFAVIDVEVLAPPGKGKFAVFAISEAMLAAE